MDKKKLPHRIEVLITHTQMCNPRIERRGEVLEMHADTQSQTHNHRHLPSETLSEKWECWRRRIITRLARVKSCPTPSVQLKQ